jgi:phage FluMu gp28-like protein
MKIDLAVRLKNRFTDAKVRIPYDTQIRAELQAIKRQSTGGGVTFDAPRIEVDTAVAGGARRKVTAHADAFWAKALADLAADNGVCELGMTESPVPSSYSQTGGYL